MKSLITTTLLAAALTTFSFADDNDVSLDQCPPAVQNTLRENLRGGHVDDIDLITVDGKKLYVAEIEMANDDDLEVHVAEDGTLIKTREEIQLSKVPAAVREALTSFGGEIDDLEIQTAGSTKTYHADIDRKDQSDLDVIIAEDGKVIRETEDND